MAGTTKPISLSLFPVISTIILFSADFFKKCALGLPVDGPEDDKISCFHKGKKTSDGRNRLENQMKLLTTCELNEDPFTHTDEDIIAAAEFAIIDDNDDEDINIED